MAHTTIHVLYYGGRKGEEVPKAKPTLFHGMLLLQSWLDFLHLLGKEVYLPLEEVLGIFSCLLYIVASSHIDEHMFHIM